MASWYYASCGQQNGQHTALGHTQMHGNYSESGMYYDYVVGHYNDYSNYGGGGCNSCQNNCQVCNKCQTKCENKQLISAWIGTLDFDNVGYEIEPVYVQAQIWNDLIDYINRAAIEAELKDANEDIINIGQYKVSIANIIFPTEFNIINDTINKFIDAQTNIETKKAKDYVLKDYIDIFKDQLNNHAKISPSICCNNCQAQSEV